MILPTERADRGLERGLLADRPAAGEIDHEPLERPSLGAKTVKRFDASASTGASSVAVTAWTSRS